MFLTLWACFGFWVCTPRLQLVLERCDIKVDLSERNRAGGVTLLDLLCANTAISVRQQICTCRTKCTSALLDEKHAWMHICQFSDLQWHTCLVKGRTRFMTSKGVFLFFSVSLVADKLLNLPHRVFKVSVWCILKARFDRVHNV